MPTITPESALGSFDHRAPRFPGYSFPASAPAFPAHMLFPASAPIYSRVTPSSALSTAASSSHEPLQPFGPPLPSSLLSAGSNLGPQPPVLNPMPYTATPRTATGSDVMM